MHFREGKPATLKDLGERAETYLEAHSADIVFGIDPKFSKMQNSNQGRAINVDHQDILGLNVLDRVQEDQVHHSIRLIGQVHLFQHQDQQRFTHSLTAARNRLWVVAPSMLTGHQQEPMRQQQ